MIYVYGDSFAYGSDLKPNDRNVAVWLGKELQTRVVNRSMPGNSNVVMCHQLIEDITLSKLNPDESSINPASKNPFSASESCSELSSLSVSTRVASEAKAESLLIVTPESVEVA